MNKQQYDHIVQQINRLRVPHYICEDPWFSCPKSEEGCANDNAPDECTCIAEEHEQRVVALLQWLERANLVDEKPQSYCLYTLRRRTIDSNKFYGPYHGSHDAKTTLCGQKIDANFWITDNTATGIVTCGQCTRALVAKRGVDNGRE